MALLFLVDQGFEHSLVLSSDLFRTSCRFEAALRHPGGTVLQMANDWPTLHQRMQGKYTQWMIWRGY